MKPHRAYDKVDDYQTVIRCYFKGKRKPLRFKFHPPRTIGKADGRKVTVYASNHIDDLRGTARVFNNGIIIYTNNEDGTTTHTALRHDNVIGWMFDNTEFLIEYGRRRFPDKLRQAVVDSAE